MSAEPPSAPPTVDSLVEGLHALVAQAGLTAGAPAGAAPVVPAPLLAPAPSGALFVRAPLLPLPPPIGGPPGGIAAPPGGLLLPLVGAPAPLPGASPHAGHVAPAASAPAPRAEPGPRHLVGFDEVPPPTSPPVESLLEPVPGLWQAPTTPLARRVPAPPPPPTRARDEAPTFHDRDEPRDLAQRFGDTLFPLIKRLARALPFGPILLVAAFGIVVPVLILRLRIALRGRLILSSMILLVWLVALDVVI